jgi:hypothetical protein
MLPHHLRLNRRRHGHDQDRKAVLRTIIEYDYDDPTHAAQRLGSADTTNVVAAALTVAARRRFGETPDQKEVSAYIKQLRASSEGAAETIPQNVGEALIRGMLGEPDLLDQVHPDAFIHAGILISYSLTAEQDLDEDGRNQFVTEADELAAQWEAEV